MSAPRRPSLLPDSAEVGADGWLRIGGCTSATLAERVRHPAVRLRRGPPAGPLPRGGRGVRRRRGLRHEGVPLPGHGRASPTRRACTSTSPPAASCTSRWPPAFRPSGSCCTATTRAHDELRRRREAGVGRIVVDSFDELDRLDALHAEDGLVPQVLLRVTPGVEAHTHEFVRTGQDDSKFGFGVATGDGGRGGRARRRGSPARRARRRARAHRQPGVRRRLLPPGDRGDRPVRRRARPAGAVDRRRPGRRLRRGRGGADDRRVGRRSREACADAGITARVTAEPGRSIVAAAAVTLYTVGTIKDLPGIRTYVVGRRRHERQPPARALRQRLRDVPAPGAVRRPAPRR